MFLYVLLVMVVYIKTFIEFKFIEGFNIENHYQQRFGGVFIEDAEQERAR